MLKLQYDMGHSPVNIYMDRPNIYLGQLVDINAKLFIAGQYNLELPSEFNRVKNITPDIKPNIIISQTKLENFEILMSIAKEFNAAFIHYESNFIPTSFSKKECKILKTKSAQVNIFTNESLMNTWGFDSNNSIVIENGFGGPNIKNDKPYIVSNTLPISHMYSGFCPVVFKTPHSSKFIKDAFNGFLYSDESELKYITGNLDKMDAEDLGHIGQNAKNLVLTKFKKEIFLSKWKNLIRNII